MASGSQPGERRGGRKKGIPNARTAKNLASQLGLVEKDVSPLEYLLSIMREPDFIQLKDEEPSAYLARLKAQRIDKIDCAKAAAPYVHAKLAQIQVKDDPEQHADKMKAAAMDKTELARRIAFALASATAVMADPTYKESDIPTFRKG